VKKQCTDILDLIKCQKAENEELRKGFTADADYFASEYDSKIKSEAIKGFAEEFEKRCIASGVYPAVTKNILKKLVKERTEVKDDESVCAC
jgi:signal recognition particle GTPase